MKGILVLLAILLVILLLYTIFSSRWGAAARDKSRVDSFLLQMKRQQIPLLDLIKGNNMLGLYPFMKEPEIPYPIFHINSREDHEESDLPLLLRSSPLHHVNLVEEKCLDGASSRFVSNMIIMNEDTASLAKSELATLSSHLLIIQKAFERNHSIALLVGHGVSSRNFFYYWKNFLRMIEDAPPDWSLIHLHSGQLYPAQALHRILPYQKVRDISCIAYAISRRGMLRVLEEPAHKELNLYLSTEINGDGVLQAFLNRRFPDAYMSTTNFFTPRSPPSRVEFDFHEYMNPIPHINSSEEMRFACALKGLGGLMDQLKVPYTVFFGTLLGVVREGGFVRGDGDLDIAVLAREDYIQSCLKIQTSEFRIKHVYKTQQEIREVKLEHIPTGLNADIFFLSEEGGSFIYHSFHEICEGTPSKSCRFRLTRFNFTRKKFLNFEIGFLDAPILALQECYDDDWFVPRSYSYDAEIRECLTPSMIFSDFDPPRQKSARHVDTSFPWWPQKIREQGPHLWLYWQNASPSSTRPAYLDLCLQTIVLRCPSFNVMLVDDVKVKKICRRIHPNFTNITPLAMRSDYVSFSLLAEYGGVYLDMDTILLSDLDFVLRTLETSQFIIGAHKPEDGKLDVSVGFMAGIANNKVCLRALDILEELPWTKHPMEVPWGYETPRLTEFMQDLLNVHPDEVAYYDIYKLGYVVNHWSASKDYFWAVGDVDETLFQHPLIILHNETYTADVKALSSEDVLNSQYRIGHIFRHVLSQGAYSATRRWDESSLRIKNPLCDTSFSPRAGVDSS